MKIDGKEIAQKILRELELKVKKLQEKNINPTLAIIIVGNDPASVAYVKRKEIKAEEVGIKTITKSFEEKISEKDLLAVIQQFNNDKNIHGIIVQQPLPNHINTEIITQAVDPKKDVDGFLPNSEFEEPIANAVLESLKNIFTEPLKSKKIMVIGKGETGGKPVINLLKKIGINPEIIDSKTQNPGNITKNADIIIVAVGKPNTIKPEMLKKGVILIGIGISRGRDGKLVGDYDEGQIKDIASFYTPTPGGIGPINIAMLLKNVVMACENFSR